MGNSSSAQSLDEETKVGNNQLEFSTFLIDLPANGMRHETNRVFADGQLNKQSGLVMFDPGSEMLTIEFCRL